MSGTLNKAFMKDPMLFMHSHIIEMAWGFLPGRDNSRVYIENFDLVAIGNAADGTPRVRLESYTTNSTGHAKAHGAHSHPITAYWLPYQANSYCETTLGNAADYMFTATLTGCTLAVGSGPTPKVSHINYQAGTAIDSTRIRHKFMKHHRFDVGARSIDKDDYFYATPATTQAHTVVGIRRAGGWEFYLNSRQGTGTGAQLLSGSTKIHQTF